MGILRGGGRRSDQVLVGRLRCWRSDRVHVGGLKGGGRRSDLVGRTRGSGRRS